MGNRITTEQAKQYEKLRTIIEEDLNSRSHQWRVIGRIDQTELVKPAKRAFPGAPKYKYKRLLCRICEAIQGKVCTRADIPQVITQVAQVDVKMAQTRHEDHPRPWTVILLQIQTTSTGKKNVYLHPHLGPAEEISKLDGVVKRTKAGRDIEVWYDIDAILQQKTKRTTYRRGPLA